MAQYKAFVWRYTKNRAPNKERETKQQNQYKKRTND